MTITEILSLKKRAFFKRPIHTNWMWNDSIRIFVVLSNDILGVDANYEKYDLRIEDLLATDWDFKREQPKVAQYLYLKEQGKHSVTTEAFYDDNQFTIYYPNAKIFKRLEEMDIL